MDAVLCDRCGLETTPNFYIYRRVHNGKEITFDLCVECTKKLDAFIYEDAEHMINLGNRYNRKEFK